MDPTRDNKEWEWGLIIVGALCLSLLFSVVQKSNQHIKNEYIIVDSSTSYHLQ